jgi:hypothetical protein
MKIRMGLFLLAALLSFTTKAFAADPNFYIFLCFGQSNMDGAGKIEEQDKSVDERFQVLVAIDAPNQNRKRGTWYPAAPPLCRGTGGLSAADYFGRTMVANLPKNVRMGVINVAIPGCKIELFEKDTFKTYVKTAPPWMTNFIKGYDGDPYQHLLSMAKLAQKDGVIKGILLHQGESNPNDREWPVKVKGIYDNLIKDLDLKADQVPLLAGETVSPTRWRLSPAILPRFGRALLRSRRNLSAGDLQRTTDGAEGIAEVVDVGLGGFGGLEGTDVLDVRGKDKPSTAAFPT